MKKEDKTPRDENNRPHGYWEWYQYGGKIWYKGNFIHGEEYGYWEVYYHNGDLRFKEYYIK